MDIKEIKDVFAALEVLGVDAKKALADKKVNLADLPLLMDLVKNSDLFVEAAKGVGDIPAEIKDMEQAELIEIVGLVFGLLKKIKEA